MVTRRRCSVPREALAPGVQAQTLYLAEPSRALRRGEPLRVRLIELAPGARWSCGDAPDRHREVLVLTGSIRLGGSPPRDAERLSLRDYHVVPAGHAWPVIESADGALLFVRESALVDEGSPRTVHDAEAGWPAFAPGIRRRVLWSRGSEAALLYHAEPGASVPLHTHGHDEECLMVQGELFLDDLLLQGGDWQLAPAGTGHHTTATDTGVVIYAHGDLDLQFVG
jgi:quercetin dioxygenase-like cupin family protein